MMHLSGFIQTVLPATLFWVTACASPGSAMSAEAIDDVLLVRVRTEGRDSWRTVSDTLNSKVFDVEGTDTMHDGTSNATDDETDATLERTKDFSICFDLRDSRELIEQTVTLDAVPWTTRFVVNERYGFAIYRKVDDPFALNQGVRRTDGEDLPYLNQHLDYRWFLNAGCYVWFNVTVEELILGDPFRLTTINAVTSPEGINRIRLEAIYHGAGLNDGTLYWAEVNPEHEWLVDRAGAENEAKDFKYIVEVEYETATKERSIPVRVVSTRAAFDEVSDPLFDRQTVTFGKISECHHSANEFYLPYYEISEAALESFTPSQNHRRMWFLAGNAGILLALFLFYLAKRYRKTAKPK